MISHSMLSLEAEAGGSSTFSEERITKRQQSTEIKKNPGAEDDLKKRGYSSFPDNRPSAKRQKNNEFKYTSMAGNDFLCVAPNDLEFEIEKAKFEIFNHFRNMKTQMDNGDKVMTKEMEIWTKGGLASINGGKSPQNDFIIKSLIDNFEEVIRNIGHESRRDVNYTMDDIRKILVKLFYAIEVAFKPRPHIDAAKVTRRDTVHFLWICLLSIIAVLIGVFPDYVIKLFESAVAFYQSTILLFFLFCMLHFYNPSSK